MNVSSGLERPVVTDLALYARNVAIRARAASRQMALATGAQKGDWLRRTAQLIRERKDEILKANEDDCSDGRQTGLSPAMSDRLKLTEPRLESIAQSLHEVASLPEPVGEIIDSNVRPNGLLVTRVRVPLGVVFFIYESRPNVTVDAASLCAKSGNAVILRGGKEAIRSNQTLASLMSDALKETGLPRDAVQLVETTDREAVGKFLRLHEYIDLAIPRGGRSLIERVSAEATMPVLKHFDGICHVYVDRSADLEMAERILVNSKCQRPGVCNAAECLLVHRDIAAAFLPKAAKTLQKNGVELRCCERSRALIPSSRAATDDDYRTEYLDLILSVKVVDSLADAIHHIDAYGSHHTDTIVTNDITAAETFVAQVDSAAVLVNASTRFNDGNQLGLGAEIGISTDKFHARGPCGLKELTSYKYVVHGSGQVRT
jgi:glutamate-5-semialdehyde dehydrogenase